MSDSRSEAVVVTRNVRNIFGDRASEAMEAVRRDGLTRAELPQRFRAPPNLPSTRCWAAPVA